MNYPMDHPQTEPHHFHRKGWRFWLCSACYAPRAAHPVRAWVKARYLHDNRYVSLKNLRYEDLAG